MSEKQLGSVAGGLPADAKSQTSIGMVKPNPWLCPVCGLKRNMGNHKKCSKITHLKHRKGHIDI